MTGVTEMGLIGFTHNDHLDVNMTMNGFSMGDKFHYRCKFSYRLHTQ
jgi:hypothetical protein